MSTSRPATAAKRILIAPQAFKGTADAPMVASAIARGIHQVYPDATCIELPLADGGDGTVGALVRATEGSLRSSPVHGPLGRAVDAEWGVLGDGTTAVVEMAAASGLGLLRPGERDPLLASTRGTGELLVAVAAAGFRRIIIGLGGSATNDGGAGFARAIGYEFLDARGRALADGGAALAHLDRISGAMNPRLVGVTVIGASDVRNSLLGPDGATAIYGPQKGARAQDLPVLEQALGRYADVLESFLGRTIRDLPGAGAAGGLGAALLGFLAITLTPGAELVMEASGFNRLLVGADFVITGEGRLDEQSQYGKLTHAVSLAARRAGVPIGYVVGSASRGARQAVGEDAVVALAPEPGALFDRISAAARQLMQSRIQ